MLKQLLLAGGEAVVSRKAIAAAVEQLRPCRIAIRTGVAITHCQPRLPSGLPKAPPRLHSSAGGWWRWRRFQIALAVAEPWYLVSNAEPNLDLVWAYGQRFCCEQLFRDQKSGLFQLESSGLREPERIDRLLLVVAIAVLVGSLQSYAVSLAGECRSVDPHWQRGLSFVQIGLASLQ